jgi:hypothetical protein
MKNEVILFSFLMIMSFCNSKDRELTLNFIVSSNDTVTIYLNEIEIVDSHNIALVNKEKLNAIKEVKIIEVFLINDIGDKKVVALQNILSSSLPESEFHILSSGNREVKIFKNNQIGCSKELMKKLNPLQ